MGFQNVSLMQRMCIACGEFRPRQLGIEVSSLHFEKSFDHQQQHGSSPMMHDYDQQKLVC